MPGVLAMLLPAAHALDLSGVRAEDLVRVDEPDFPGAIATSDRGSLLLAPPADGTPWRPEPVPELEAWFPYGAWGARGAAEAIAVGPWHDRGWRGQGVRVAVFDLQWFGREAAEAELGPAVGHDCFDHPMCTVELDDLRPHFDFEVGQHGIACAEVLRDVAPDVELHLVRVNGLTTLEAAADWAIREGVDFVSLSMTWATDSFRDGSGSVGEVVERLAEAGVVLVAAAGNYAQRHFADTFEDDGEGRHRFSWGSSWLPIWLGAGADRTVTLQWDQHHACGETDLDIELVAEDGAILGRSEGRQDPGDPACQPVERIRVDRPEAGWTWLRILRVAGSSRLRLDVTAGGGTIWNAMPETSVADPAAHPLAVAVGAIEAEGYLDNPVEGFSSQGPNGDGRPKPDLAGPDGLDTSVFGTRGFYGTSAATPVTVGAMAVVASRYPDLAPREVAELVTSWAWRDAPAGSGPDPAMGAGRLRLPAPGGCAPGCLDPGGGSAALLLLPGLAAGACRRRSAR